MKKSIKHLAFTAIAMMLGSPLFAQTTLNVASHQAKIDGITYEYSIGEMALIETHALSNLIVTQGLLQPLSMPRTPNVTNDLVIEPIAIIQVYPNPTQHELFIEADDIKSGSLSLQLYDVLGKLVFQEIKQTTNGANKFSINMNTFSAGNYILIANNKPLNNISQKQIFKIQKTQ